MRTWFLMVSTRLPLPHLFTAGPEDAFGAGAGAGLAPSSPQLPIEDGLPGFGTDAPHPELFAWEGGMVGWEGNLCDLRELSELRSKTEVVT